jgi:hypothetical protein
VSPSPIDLHFAGDDVVATMIAVSFAAGLNVYATIATLGLLARANVVALPPGLAVLSNEWVIGASLVLFVVEFFADKIPIFDLVWNVLQTFVRVPAAAVLAWSATASLSPGGQLIAAIAGGAIALAAHGGKLAVRSAATTSPEPFSSRFLSAAEDVVAVGLTWFAAEHPYLAAGIALGLLIAIVIVIRLVWRVLVKSVRYLRDRRALGVSE